MNVMIGNAVQVFQERMTTVADHAARVFRENGYTVDRESLFPNRSFISHIDDAPGSLYGRQSNLAPDYLYEEVYLINVGEQMGTHLMQQLRLTLASEQKLLRSNTIGLIAEGLSVVLYFRADPLNVPLAGN
jgi:hypothetical protein